MSLELIHELRLQKESAKQRVKALLNQLYENNGLQQEIEKETNKITALSGEIEIAKSELPRSAKSNDSNKKRKRRRSLAELLELLNKGEKLGTEDIKRLKAAIKKGEKRLKDIKNLRAAEKKLGLSINRQTRRVTR